MRAIQEGRGEDAAQQMQAHLRHVEDSIKAPQDPGGEIDFAQIFGLKGPASKG